MIGDGQTITSGSSEPEIASDYICLTTKRVFQNLLTARRK